MDEPLTTELRDGRTVLAKLYKGSPSAITYANLTQAKRAADKAGPQWYVSGFRPFFVTLRKEESHG